MRFVDIKIQSNLFGTVLGGPHVMIEHCDNISKIGLQDDVEDKLFETLLFVHYCCGRSLGALRSDFLVDRSLSLD